MMPPSLPEPVADDLLCPACGAATEPPEDPILGEVLWCAECGAELELISVEPVRLGLYEEEEK